MFNLSKLTIVFSLIEKLFQATDNSFALLLLFVFTYSHLYIEKLY